MTDQRELPVYRALNELNIEYERFEHKEALTMEDCESIGKDAGAEHFKNLFLCNRQGTDFYMVLLRADKMFRTAEVSKQLGVSRLSFASPAQLGDKLKLLPGAVSPLALLNDENHEITVAVDRDILSLEKIMAHPMVNTASVAMKGTDLFRFLDWLSNKLVFVTIQ
ncbi:MAG: Prolyl-tRNA editing protein ProX [Firmicutes bacterium ADurb.Bin182]|nr:MAG: Prolyl-tRNA editing protein ProX [Firmicutes bacterium ADurb.Bin182]